MDINKYFIGFESIEGIDLDELYICNIIDKRKQQGLSEHCLKQCLHGRFHYNCECTKEEWCNLHASGELVKVKCRKIKKKEINELERDSSYYGITHKRS